MAASDWDNRRNIPPYRAERLGKMLISTPLPSVPLGLGFCSKPHPLSIRDITWDSDNDTVVLNSYLLGNLNHFRHIEYDMSCSAESEELFQSLLTYFLEIREYLCRYRCGAILSKVTALLPIAFPISRDVISRTSHNPLLFSLSML